MDRDYRTRKGKGIRVGKEIGHGIESETLFSPGSKYCIYTLQYMLCFSPGVHFNHDNEVWDLKK